MGMAILGSRTGDIPYATNYIEFTFANAHYLA
jgi:hypothetical protein